MKKSNKILDNIPDFHGISISITYLQRKLKISFKQAKILKENLDKNIGK